MGRTDDAVLRVCEQDGLAISGQDGKGKTWRGGGHGVGFDRALGRRVERQCPRGMRLVDGNQPVRIDLKSVRDAFAVDRHHLGLICRPEAAVQTGEYAGRRPALSGKESVTNRHERFGGKDFDHGSNPGGTGVFGR